MRAAARSVRNAPGEALAHEGRTQTAEAGLKLSAARKTALPWTRKGGHAPVCRPLDHPLSTGGANKVLATRRAG